MSNFNEFSKQVFEANKLKGFDVSKENIGQTLMLVVSELSEALEADRKKQHADLTEIKNLFVDPEDYTWENSPYSFIEVFERDIKDTFEDEIADSFIRLFDLAGGLGIDIDFHIAQKRKYNSFREFKHGKAY